jgi:hypothetical protein
VCQGSEKRFILRKLFSSSFQAMLVKRKERKKLQQSFKQTVVSRGRAEEEEEREGGCEEVVFWELY